ncbi:imidazolonepropionase [Paucihalobacter ruber]|uniref:Imidazolonepropionase n=1 Tax=Paucihalobacter ruber TaxID=2567861 RepID=A0A506PFN0_9FLAO|nr:imidazolonepropionase [Paucihalobacter ruber]TPV32409.1 imidazolonepropionase [Paucihalobacter ruber]
MSILITNIKELLQVYNSNVTILKGKEMNNLPVLKDAYLYLENDTIVEYGPMSDCDGIEAETTIDASGRVVLPAWCDSHTHLVYPEDRAGEFIDRINGLTYEEIAKKGGGILNSAKKLQEKSEEQLYNQALERLNKLLKLGTGVIEIKSGYGLTVESELKMLRVIQRLKKETQAFVKVTFLGAHAIPEKFKKNKKGYIDMIIKEMLPKIYEENLAHYIDVFCEEGYFTLEDTELILKAAQKYNLPAKIHVNQFNAFGGVELAVKYKALSVDHLEELTSDDIDALKKSNTMPVALPQCSFFLGIPYTNARAILDAGLPLAIASDYNPGSAPSGNMNFVLSLACIKLKMTPEEAINAATINGAYALGLSSMYGSITRGKKANIIITKPISGYQLLPYSFGENLIDTVIVNGIIH